MIQSLFACTTAHVAYAHSLLSQADRMLLGACNCLESFMHMMCCELSGTLLLSHAAFHIPYCIPTVIFWQQQPVLDTCSGLCCRNGCSSLHGLSIPRMPSMQSGRVTCLSGSRKCCWTTLSSALKLPSSCCTGVVLSTSMMR